MSEPMPLEAGDIAWVDLNPVRGTEQGGRRPVLILTDRSFHELSTRAIVCPITSRVRGWPTEVPLPEGLKAEGVVLVDQVRSVDRAKRDFEHIDRAPAEVLRQVRGRLAELLQIADLFQSEQQN